MDEFETFARPISAKATLFVFDTCFSGYMFEAMRRGGTTPPPPVIWAKVNAQVRELITAGTAEQQVPARSIFRTKFVEGIGGRAALDRDGYVTGRELCYFLTAEVANASGCKQTPVCGRSDPENGGDFLFVVPPGPEPPNSSPLETQYKRSGWMGDGGERVRNRYQSLTK